MYRVSPTGIAVITEGALGSVKSKASSGAAKAKTLMHAMANASKKKLIRLSNGIRLLSHFF